MEQLTTALLALALSLIGFLTVYFQKRQSNLEKEMKRNQTSDSITAEIFDLVVKRADINKYPVDQETFNKVLAALDSDDLVDIASILYLLIDVFTALSDEANPVIVAELKKEIYANSTAFIKSNRRLVRKLLIALCAPYYGTIARKE